jgi:hypothetical protein
MLLAVAARDSVANRHLLASFWSGTFERGGRPSIVDIAESCARFEAKAARQEATLVDVEQLRGLWSAALETAVNADTHFFVDGGDSFAGAMLVADVNEVAGTELTLQDLIENSRLVTEAVRAAGR